MPFHIFGYVFIHFTSYMFPSWFLTVCYPSFWLAEVPSVWITSDNQGPTIYSVQRHVMYKKLDSLTKFLIQMLRVSTLGSSGTHSNNNSVLFISSLMCLHHSSSDALLLFLALGVDKLCLEHKLTRRNHMA